MGKRHIRNLTEIIGITTECECGGVMTVWHYGSQYWGVCGSCGNKSEPYHSTFALRNEQHKKIKKINMREATKDERNAIDCYIDSISLDVEQHIRDDEKQKVIKTIREWAINQEITQSDTKYCNTCNGFVELRKLIAFLDNVS